MNQTDNELLQKLTQDFIDQQPNSPLVMQLLKIINDLLEENKQLKETIQILRDTINQLKGEQGQIKIPEKKGKNGDISSEKERKRDPPKERKGRGARNEKIKITREEKCYYPRDQLPPDAVFKGFQPVIVQNIKIEPDNIKFLVEVYYSPSTGKTYRAPRPIGFEGEYGIGVRNYILSMKHQGNVSESRIQELLASMGVFISKSSISRIARRDMALFHEEANEILKAGISTADFVNIDDTGAKVNGEQHYTQIICNPLFTAYITTPHKNRLSILNTLLIGSELQFTFNDDTFELLALFKVPEKVQNYLKSHCFGKVMNSEELKEHIASIPSKNQNIDQLHRRIMEAAGIVWYHTQDQIPIVPGIISDDAPQFRHIADWQALCWIHAGRPIKKLIPTIPIYQEEVSRTLTDFWDYYKTLLDFQKNPESFSIDELRDRFDSIFTRTTGYSELDKILQSIMANKEKLLMVLSNPKIPLHNNDAELGARAAVRKRDVSLQTQSVEGTKVVDTALTILQTAKKLAVNPLEYIWKRIAHIETETLPELILKIAGSPG